MYNALGRRKKSIARVYLTKGKGNVTINKRTSEEYLNTDILRYKVQQPFLATNTTGEWDVNVLVHGGGITGQAEAIRLGIARALVSVNEEFRPMLTAEGLMTRDPRMVERKKFGQKKARKRFQFSKR